MTVDWPCDSSDPDIVVVCCRLFTKQPLQFYLLLSPLDRSRCTPLTVGSDKDVSSASARSFVTVGSLRLASEAGLSGMSRVHESK